MFATVALALKLGLNLAEKEQQNAHDHELNANTSSLQGNNDDTNSTDTDEVKGRSIGKSVIFKDSETATDSSLAEGVTPGDPGPLAVEGAHKHHHASASAQQSLKWPPPSGSLHAQYRRAAVATDHGSVERVNTHKCDCF